EGPSTERNPGETELYNKVLELARVVSDPDIVSEALLIADMYRKALDINGGFNTVKKAIGNFINTQLEDVDPDDEESPLNDLESVLNDMHNDLSRRAKEAGGGFNKGDNPSAEKEIRAVKNQFNEQSLKDELAGRNKSTSDLSDIDPEAVAKFDLSGGVGMEEAQSKGRGYFVRNVKEPKDWIQSYENERQRYLEELPTDRDPKTAERKRKLITLLDQLKLLTAKEAKLNAENQVAPDPATQQELANIRGQLKKAKQERIAAKAAIRQNTLTRQTDQLMKEYENVRDPLEKLRLEHELLLRKTMRSADKNKGEETKLRKQLLDFLPHMSKTPMGQATLKNLLDKIKAAENKKIPIAEWNKQQATEIAKKMQKVEITEELQKAREESGLGRYQNKHLPGVREWTSIKLSGYVENLSKAMLAERKTAKDRLVGSKNRKVKEEKKSKFKPYLDSIADATKAKDRKSMLNAVSALRKAVQQEVELLPEFSQFVLSVRLSKSFHKFKDTLSTLDKMGIEEKESLNDKEVEAINQVINMGEGLVNYFSKLEIKSIGPQGTNFAGPSGPAYNNPYATQINIINNACMYLQNILERAGSISNEEE